MQTGVSDLKYLDIRLGAVAVLFATPLMADTPPPAGALPLSDVISGIEASADVQWIDEVEWDDDGYWEVEYYLTDGSKVSVKLDPMTGEPRS